MRGGSTPTDASDSSPSDHVDPLVQFAEELEKVRHMSVGDERRRRLLDLVEQAAADLAEVAHLAVTQFTCLGLDAEAGTVAGATWSKIRECAQGGGKCASSTTH